MSDFSMYDTDDFEIKETPNTAALTLKKSQFTTEVKIGDQTITVINPEYINFVNQRIVALETKNAVLENELRNLKQSVRQRDITINSIATKLNTGFGNYGQR